MCILVWVHVCTVPPITVGGVVDGEDVMVAF